MIFVLAAFLLLCCLAVIIGGKLGGRRKEQAESPTKPPGVGLGRWLAGAVMVIVPAVWLLAFSFGWFSSIFRAMRSPTGIPRITQLTSSSATPIPLTLFGLGGLLILGPLVIAYDLYFISRWLFRKGFGSAKNDHKGI